MYFYALKKEFLWEHSLKTDYGIRSYSNPCNSICCNGSIFNAAPVVAVSVACDFHAGTDGLACFRQIGEVLFDETYRSSKDFTCKNRKLQPIISRV